MAQVTDPALLAQLNGDASSRVTDPAVLAQLNGTTSPQPAPDYPSHGFSFTGAAGMLNRAIDAAPTALNSAIDSGFGLPELYRNARDLGNGRIDPSTPEGALTGASVASNFVSPSPASSVGRIVSRAAPSQDALYASGGAKFDALRRSDLAIRPDAAAGLGRTIQGNLESDGARDFAPGQKPVFDAVSELGTLGRPQSGVGPPRPLNYSDMEAPRKVLNEIPYDGTPGTKGGGAAYQHARDAIHQIDDYMGAIPKEDVLKGDPAAVSAMAKDARGDWAGGARSAVLTNAQKRGDNRAMVTGTGANNDNAIRQRVLQVREDPSLMRGRTPEEIDALDYAMGHGAHIGNAARYLGTMAPTGLHSILGNAAAIGGAAEAGHPLMGLIPAAVGIPSKMAATILTRSRLRAADELGRANTPLGKTMPTQSTQSAMSPVAAMMLGLGANRNQSQ